MTTQEYCSKCQGVLTVTTHKEKIRVARQIFQEILPANNCGTCGRNYVAPEDHTAFMLRVARELGNVGPMSGEIYSFIRKALGMTREELAVLLELNAVDLAYKEADIGFITLTERVILNALVCDQLAGRTTILDMCAIQRKIKK